MAGQMSGWALQAPLTPSLTVVVGGRQGARCDQPHQHNAEDNDTCRMLLQTPEQQGVSMPTMHCLSDLNGVGTSADAKPPADLSLPQRSVDFSTSSTLVPKCDLQSWLTSQCMPSCLPSPAIRKGPTQAPNDQEWQRRG
jgi:hypothetical protein